MAHVRRSSGCCKDKPSASTENDRDGALCLALVRQNGDGLAVFDRTGEVRSFSYDGDVRKLCFSSHNSNADDLLTPCLDSEGNHGVPDESCFCGVDDPHIHAHLYDAKTCGSDSHDNDLSKLARVTLRAGDVKSKSDDDNSFVVELPVPKHQHGPKIQRDGNDSKGAVEVSRKQLGRVQHHDHEDLLVHDLATGDLHLQHRCDDCGHDDVHGTLVLLDKRRIDNEAFGGRSVNLHLFRVPEAQSVGAATTFTDANGSEDKLAGGTETSEVNDRPSRQSSCTKSQADDRENECNKQQCCNKTTKLPTTSVSNVTDKATCCGQDKCCNTDDACVSDEDGCCHDCPCCNKSAAPASCCSNGPCSPDRKWRPEVVAPEPPVDERERLFAPGTVVRSTIECRAMCCSSGVRVIEKLLRDKSGVQKCMCNGTLRQVVVDHDVSILSAADISGILNEGKMKAHVLSDGECMLLPKDSALDTFGRSTIFAEKICCASEVPAINSILTPIKGVQKVSINVTNKLVYVDHDTAIVSAQQLSDALNDARFRARIQEDAAAQLSAHAVSSSVVLSIFEIVTMQHDGNNNSEDEIERLKQCVCDYLSTIASSMVHSYRAQIQGRHKSVRVVVNHNPLTMPTEQLVQSIRETLGPTAYDVTTVRNGSGFVTWDFNTIQKNVNTNNKFGGDDGDEVKEEQAKLRPTVVASGVFWIVSMLSLVGGKWEHLKYVALISVLFGIPPIAFKAYQSVNRLQLDANCLMFSASMGALALQEFTEAAAVTFLFALSEWLEVRATARARNALSAIVRLRPDSANLIHPETKEIVVVRARAVPLGAMVSVRSGDKFPCDGVVVEGSTTVDESSLTGESRPVRKRPGDVVSGGTVNTGSTQLTVQTTATSDDSAVARLIRLVEEAQTNRSNTEKLVDDFARVYTPVIVLSALLMCTVPWAWGREIGNEWAHNGLVLLVVACPCALIISTPVSYVAGLAATAQRGVLVKGGAHLEALGQVRHVCFDKTGTLTQGKFQLLHLGIIKEGADREYILRVLACMEERASHPLADSILQAVKNEGVSIPCSMYVTDHTFLAGEGITGVIQGKRVNVGNLRLFERLGLLDALDGKHMKIIKHWEANGGTVGLMSIEGEGIVCSYCVADAVRPEAKNVVSVLRRLGISVTMLTGDNQEVADVIGKSVGLSCDEVKGQLLPEEKLELVESLKMRNRKSDSNDTPALASLTSGMQDSSGQRSVLASLCSTPTLVLMCGDGVNDAPALATANIGVAMGAGAAVAMETADVTLLDSHLGKLVYSIQMGRRVIRKIKENVVFSISLKFLVLGFALAGKAALWAAIVSDVGGMILVTLNGLMLLPASKKASAGDGEGYHDGATDDDEEIV